MGRPKSVLVRILEVVDKPLGFFVLALLIIESFLALVLSLSNLNEEHKFYGLLLGVGMFLFVVVVVSFIVAWKPQNLTYDRDAHLIDRGKATFGTDAKPVAAIETLLATQEKAGESK